MTNDIVARLREEGFVTHMARLPRESKILHDAADEIERLRDLIEGHDYLAMGQRDQMKRLRWERDQARREICRNEADDISLELGGAAIFPASVAERRGWDCYKEATDGRR